MGVNGRPVIASEKLRAVFDDQDSTNLTTVALNIINIWFKGVALCKFTRAPNFAFINILKCKVSPLATKSAENYTRDIIQAFIFCRSPLHGNGNSSVTIRINDTNMDNFLGGMYLEGLHISFDIINSSSYNLKETCADIFPAFVFMKNVLSLNAMMSTVYFTQANKVHAKIKGHISAKSFRRRPFNITISRDTLYLKTRSSHTAGTVNFKNCTISSPLKLENVKAFFDHCYFSYVASKDRIKLLTSDAIFKSCNFINNTAMTTDLKKLAIIESIISFTKFKNCWFINNRAPFGIVSISDDVTVPSELRWLWKLWNKENVFENCYFENNTATRGIIVVNSLNNIRISGSFFAGNKASSIYGSTISHAGGKLFVMDTTFNMSHTQPKLSTSVYYGGNCIYSTSEVILGNVSIRDFDSFSTQSILIRCPSLYIVHSIVRAVDVKLECLIGKEIMIHGRFNKEKWLLNNAVISCSACPSDTYSLSAGKIRIQNLYIMYSYYIKVIPVKCLKCPLGGVCKKGQIRAANNFWGYLKSKDEVRFATCPFGYCCVSTQCKSYDSCASGRHGTLCGVCDMKHTESVITPHCLQGGTCSHPWFWLVAFVGGAIYFLIFMYKKEIVMNLKRILIPRRLKCPLQSSQIEIYETNPLMGDEMLQEGDDSPNAIENGKPETFFPGLMVIIIHFYQTNAFYKVQRMPDKSEIFLETAKGILSSVFNLRFDGLFHRNLSWCPFGNLSPVPKVLFNMSFILYLLFLLLVMSILSYLCSLRRKSTFMSFSRRLVPCGLQLILLGYTTITSSLFSLLLCQPVHPSKQVLFIDGTIQCYQKWQIVILLIVICWVAPFPIALCMLYWLLHRKKMSIKMFVLLLVFPFAAILYWIFARKRTGNNLSAHVAVTENPGEEENIQNELSKELLNVIEGPFRKSEPQKTDNSRRLPWQSVQIARRLVLITVKTFLVNMVVKLFVMLLLTAFFTIHHLKVQPFSNSILNHVETGSLLMLAVICGTNILPAYNYMYPLSVSPFSRELIGTFTNIETTLVLLFPLAVGCCLTVLLCVRFVQLIFWVYLTFVRMIRACVRLTRDVK